MKRITLPLIVLFLLIGLAIPGCPGGDGGNGDGNGGGGGASFSLSNLSIQPTEVEPNETVTISVSVANTGGSQGSHNVVLNIGGVQEGSKTVTLGPGSSQGVTFSVTRGNVGTYNATIGSSLSGSFAVITTVIHIIFPDSNLEAAVREAIGKPQGPIYTSDLESLTELEAQEIGISNLTGLEYCVNLELLYLWDNNISDISLLAGLTNLQELWLGSNNISDISPLAGLTNLQELWLGGNSISDISPLAGLTNLQELWLYFNNISDISPLVENSGFSTGDTVDLSGNPLSATSVTVYIPALETRGVEVEY